MIKISHTHTESALALFYKNPKGAAGQWRAHDFNPGGRGRRVSVFEVSLVYRASSRTCLEPPPPQKNARAALNSWELGSRTGPVGVWGMGDKVWERLGGMKPTPQAGDSSQVTANLRYTFQITGKSYSSPLPLCIHLFIFCCFEIRSHSLCSPGWPFQAGLDLTEIWLPLTPECWGYRCVPPLPCSLVSYIELCLLCVDVHMCYGIGRSEVNSWELVLCFNHMRPRLGDRCLSLLSHVPLTTPPISLF